MSTNTHAAHIPALLHTLDDVTDALRISRRTVESLIASGQLRSVTIGRSRRVYRADLIDFASRGTDEIIKSGLRAIAESTD